MFTVVITEQEHLDTINEYSAFLRPFLDNSHIAFCRWRRDGRDLEDAVPDLYEKVARHEVWRLIVVCDEEGIDQKNPFDVINYRDPEQPKDMDDADYRALRRQARLEAYRQAAVRPLVRLMTWMCQPPLVNHSQNNVGEADLEFEEYLVQAREKEELRRRICGESIPQVALPMEVICLAKRCFNQEEHDIRNSWHVYQDSQYSRFYDWNLYFDKMRYLIFDILPKGHRNYSFDYIRFLYALMVLAENEVPMATLSPNRVYSLTCEDDEDALRDLLGHYDAKLAATQNRIALMVHKIKAEEKPRLTDQEASSIFCSNVTVPVSTVQEFDQSTLYVPSRSIGLAADCPDSEQIQWISGYQNSRKALTKYLKAPRRVLKKTSAELHRLNFADLDNAGSLNEYQLEDIADYVAEEELRMVGTKTCDLYDTERYIKRMEEQNERIHTVIERRMTRKWTVILGIMALLCYVAGFIPMFSSNIKAHNGTFFSLLFVLAGGGVMALVALIALLFLRKPLKSAYSDYNGIMKGIVNDVEGSMTQYSRYLSHACNVMRGNSVLNYCKNFESPDAARIRVLRKHEMDILCAREELHEIFGAFLPEERREVDPSDSYRYDFLRPTDFDYPMPYSDKHVSRIEFLQKGNLVQVPVDFIKAMRIRREELYD